MQKFFITWAERLIAVFAILGIIAVIASGAMIMTQPHPQGGLFPGLAIIIVGLLYVTLLAGMMFVAFGIYRNTQQTNRLLSEMLRK